MESCFEEFRQFCQRMAIFLLWKSEPKKWSFKEFPGRISKQLTDLMVKKITFSDQNLC